MKKLSVVVVALGLAVSLFGIAYAGCGNCVKQESGVSEQLRKFQADTIDLRQEMMTKRFEAQRENLKGTPDQAKIALLEADIKVLQTKIQEICSQSGLPADKCDGECGQKAVECDVSKKGGCGKGPCGGK